MRRLIPSILLAFLMSFLASCTQIETGEIGIKKNMGQAEAEALNPGWHFYNPITQKVVIVNIRERKIEETTPCFTKDTQNASLTYALTYYPDAKRAVALYSQIGPDWESKIMRSVVLGNLKTTTGQYIADELVGQRDQVRAMALQSIRSHLEERGIIVTNLELTNIDFDDAYERAVEAKSVAVQKAAEAKNKTVEVEEQAKQRTISAKAEAESMRIRSDALEKNRSLVEYEAVQKWDGKLPTYLMGNSIPFINLRTPDSMANNIK